MFFIANNNNSDMMQKMMEQFGMGKSKEPKTHLDAINYTFAQGIQPLIPENKMKLLEDAGKNIDPNAEKLLYFKCLSKEAWNIILNTILKDEISKDSNYLPKDSLKLYELRDYTEEIVLDNYKDLKFNIKDKAVDQESFQESCKNIKNLLNQAVDYLKDSKKEKFKKTKYYSNPYVKHVKNLGFITIIMGIFFGIFHYNKKNFPGIDPTEPMKNKIVKTTTEEKHTKSLKK